MSRVAHGLGREQSRSLIVGLTAWSRRDG
jgi:hypothetical protein